jgi:hypothetical protein
MPRSVNIVHSTGAGAVVIQDGRRKAPAHKAEPPKKRGLSAFVIFTEDGLRHSVQAPSLRRAVRDCGLDERKSRIVAAMAADCLPTPETEDRPFLAVFLKNPNFTPPEP